MFPQVHGVLSAGRGGASPVSPFAIAGVTTAGHDPVGNSHAINLPAGSGGLLIVIAKAALASTGAWATPSGWTKTATAGENTSGWPVVVFTRVADGSEDPTLTLTSTNSVGTPTTAGSALIAYRITGAHGDVEVAFTSLANPPTLTPSWGLAENLWIAAFTSRRSDGVFTAAPTNYGDLTTARSPAASTANTHAQAASAHRLHSAATEDPAAFGFTGTTNGLYTATIAVRPAT